MGTVTTENKTEASKDVISSSPSTFTNWQNARHLYGRNVIYTDYAEVTSDNVLKILGKTLQKHLRNRLDIQYLYDVYRGKQDILNRVKVYNAEINNKIVENHANEIVSFKSGYFAGEPINYISREEDEAKRKSVDTLNKFMLGEEKQTVDKEVSDWFHICGVGYKMAYLDIDHEYGDDVPFEVHCLDPRNTYVVYYNGLGNKPVMAVRYVRSEDGDYLYDIYSKTLHWQVRTQGNITSETVIASLGQITTEEPNPIGIPIIEYPLNNARIGSFEVVMPLLNAINLLDSDRSDGVDQFIQSILLFHNVDITEEKFSSLKENGGLAYSDRDPQMKGEVKYLTNSLPQGDTQTYKDDLLNMIHEITGVPRTSDGSKSDSSNNGAVILKQGWQTAEARAKDTELMFKRAEKKFLGIVLNICSTMKGNELFKTKLVPSDIEIKFTRRNYENIYQKAQVFDLLAKDSKEGLIALKDVFQVSNLFTDSESAYSNSVKYSEELKKKQNENIEKFQEVNEDGLSEITQGNGTDNIEVS